MKPWNEVSAHDHSYTFSEDSPSPDCASSSSEECGDELQSRGAVAGTGNASITSKLVVGDISCASSSRNRVDAEEETGRLNVCGTN